VELARQEGLELRPRGLGKPGLNEANALNLRASFCSALEQVQVVGSDYMRLCSRLFQRAMSWFIPRSPKAAGPVLTGTARQPTRAQDVQPV